jgi:hypothetical protein
MSKSTYETLNTMATETSVPHFSKELVPHTLNNAVLPDGDTYLNAEKLETWARNKGVLHAVLQQGIVSGIIKIRAAFKGVKKDEVWTIKQGQNQADAWTWTAQTTPPGSNKVDKARESGHLAAGQAMAQAMKDNGMEFEVIQTNITTVYGPEVAAEILANLT